MLFQLTRGLPAFRRLFLLLTERRQLRPPCSSLNNLVLYINLLLRRRSRSLLTIAPPTPVSQVDFLQSCTQWLSLLYGVGTSVYPESVIKAFDLFSRHRMYLSYRLIGQRQRRRKTVHACECERNGSETGVVIVLDIGEEFTNRGRLECGSLKDPYRPFDPITTAEANSRDA